jgi:phosphinothricin acetyltransferase
LEAPRRTFPFACVSAENLDGRVFHAAMGWAKLATLGNVGYKFRRWIDLHPMQKT